MPLPLKKLKFLALHAHIPEEVDIITKRKRSTSPLWVAMRNGRPISPVFNNSSLVENHMAGYTEQYDIQKLHPQGDSELISKIREKYNE